MSEPITSGGHFEKMRDPYDTGKRVEPIQIRAGDLTAEHIGWTLMDRVIRDAGPIMRVWLEGTIFEDAFVDYVSEASLTLSPPAPIRRRITWADLQDVPPRDWAGVAIVDDSTAPDEIYPEADICWWLPWFRSDHDNWAVIEVPVGHPLATCGEAT